MENNYLIPKNKQDYTTVELLKSKDLATIESLADDLLFWIQDINWPIAEDLIEMLIPLDDKLVPNIKKVIDSEDYEWIYNCLYFLISRLSNEPIQKLEKDLNRLKENKSKAFIEYEIPSLVDELLERLDK